MKREKFDILVDMLEATAEASMPTHIIHKSNLSWEYMKYLNLLVEQNLVKVETITKTKWKKPRKRYYLTEKGENILKTVRKIRLTLNIGDKHG